MNINILKSALGSIGRKNGSSARKGEAEELDGSVKTLEVCYETTAKRTSFFIFLLRDVLFSVSLRPASLRKVLFRKENSSP